MANNFIKYLVYTPDYILEKDDVKLLNTTSKEELVKTIFKRDGKKIIKNLLSKKREKPNIDYRGVYIHPELSIVGIARIPEGGVLEDYEKYIHLLNDDLANYVINNIINVLDGNVADENGLNLVINKKVEEIIARKLPAIFTYKGSVDKVTNLPKDNNKVGDTYNVTSTGANYTWDGSKWDKLSETIDLSNLATKEEVKTLINEVKSKITESKEYYLVREEYEVDFASNNYNSPIINKSTRGSSEFTDLLDPSMFREYLTTDLNELTPSALVYKEEVANIIKPIYPIYENSSKKLKIGQWEMQSKPVRKLEYITKNTVKIIYTYMYKFIPDSNYDFTKDSDNDGIPDYKDPKIDKNPGSNTEDPTQPKKYIITFDTQGGTKIKNKVVEANKSVYFPDFFEVFLKDKVLVGWKDKDTLKEYKIDKHTTIPSKLITSNKTFIALWKDTVPYTITFNVDDYEGTAKQSITAKLGEKVTLPINDLLISNKLLAKNEELFYNKDIDGWMIVAPEDLDKNGDILNEAYDKYDEDILRYTQIVENLKEPDYFINASFNNLNIQLFPKIIDHKDSYINYKVDNKENILPSTIPTNFRESLKPLIHGYSQSFKYTFPKAPVFKTDPTETKYYKFTNWLFNGKKYYPGNEIQFTKKDLIVELNKYGNYINNTPVREAYRADIEIEYETIDFPTVVTDPTIPLIVNIPTINVIKEEELTKIYKIDTALYLKNLDLTKSKCEIQNNPNGISAQLEKQNKEVYLKIVISPDFTQSKVVEDYRIKTNIEKTDGTRYENIFTDFAIRRLDK